VERCGSAPVWIARLARHGIRGEQDDSRGAAQDDQRASARCRGDSNASSAPQWGTVNNATFDGGASYSSLQYKLEVRNLAGGTVLVAYTYGKCLTDGTYANQVREDNSTINYYGPCNYDLTHNFVTSYLYALPFGRGRTFGTHMNRLED
jgi:hypothetical protein